MGLSHSACVLRILFVLFTFLIALPSHARDQIRIVGSSTVYPFVAEAAEQFGKAGEFRTPVVEATGTGGGIYMFCSGVGDDSADMVNASRPIKSEELTLCRNNKVRVAELKLGYDGIVLANALASPDMKLSRKLLFLALAKYVPQGGKLIKNPYLNWRDMDASLPDQPIYLYGPPPTSGTRDAFVELVMHEGCKSFAAFKRAAKSEKHYQHLCSQMREDGRFIEAGENDNFIVQKLVASPEALGIFGYSFLEENSALVKALAIDGIRPSTRTIIDGSYHIARSLFTYVKLNHMDSVTGLHEFALLLTSRAAIGRDGFLVVKGLLPLQEAERERSAQIAEKHTAM